MRHGKNWNKSGMLIAFAACWFAAGSSASAGPVLDWLFPGAAARREARRAASSPGTVTYHVPVTSYYGGYPAWNSGTAGYAQSSYAPTTAYRTVWAPVPVTTFSPVTYVNPLAPGSVSSVQACTDYSWEARRVPYISYAPGTSYAPAAGYAPTAPAYPATTSYMSTASPVTYAIPSSVTTNYASPVSYATQATYYGTTSSSPVTYAAAPATTGCGYATGESFSPTTAPQSYSAPSSSCCSTPQSTAPAPNYAAPPTYAAPPAGNANGAYNGNNYSNGSTGFGAPSGGAPSASGLPADQSPTLDQQGYPASGSPSNGGGGGVQYQPPTNNFGRRMTEVPAISSANRPSLNAAETNGTPIAGPTSVQPNAPAQVDRVRPIPDFERQRRAWELDREPHLFDQADHTAEYSPKAQGNDEQPRFTAWEAVPIRWAVMTPERDAESSVRPIPAELDLNTTEETDRRPVTTVSRVSPVAPLRDVWRHSPER